MAIAPQPYRHFYVPRRKVLTIPQAKRLIEDVDGIGFNEYRIGPDNNGLAVQQDQYDLPETDRFGWLYRQVSSRLTEANREAGWNFTLSGWNQPLRISRYGVGYKHDWHLDYVADDASKLAFSVPLNDGYEGGQFEMLETEMPELEVGRGIFFPAYHGHRVTPVTSGARYVLLGWATGPRFR